MRQRVFLVASALMLTLSLPQAQTSTANGVDAFVRGDYQRAAEILKPIAEQSLPADPVAEFFLAALYEAGLGVPLDAVRACALYTRAAAHHEALFGAQAMALLRMRLGSLGGEGYEDCQRLARIGFDHRFEPVTFVLDPGHSIAWDLKGATITYEGKDTRIKMPLTMGPAVFLPLQHTELDVGRLRSMRRHFIEAPLWVPGHDDQTWTLTWNLFEVVRDELVTIAAEPTVVVSAQRPPTDPSFDVHKVAMVRVNDHGDAEWSVFAGPHPRTEPIEFDAARQEDRQLGRARTLAFAHVDWTRTGDLRRAPRLTYADADGCGNAKMLLYGWSDDRTEAIAVRADKALLQLSTTPKTLDVATTSGGLELALHVYERPVRSWPFCTDVTILPAASEETWRATRGTVTIELSPPGIRARAPSLYRATIRIVGAEFVDASGVRVTQQQAITLTAIVGGMGG
jgi:hypothetical protein